MVGTAHTAVLCKDSLLSVASLPTAPKAVMGYNLHLGENLGAFKDVP